MALNCKQIWNTVFLQQNCRTSKKFETLRKFTELRNFDFEISKFTQLTSKLRLRNTSTLVMQKLTPYCLFELTIDWFQNADSRTNECHNNNDQPNYSEEARLLSFAHICKSLNTCRVTKLRQFEFDRFVYFHLWTEANPIKENQL